MFGEIFLPTLSQVLHIALWQKAEQGAGYGESQRPRLAGAPPSVHSALQVEAAQRARELKREHELLPKRRKREKITMIKREWRGREEECVAFNR